MKLFKNVFSKILNIKLLKYLFALFATFISIITFSYATGNYTFGPGTGTFYVGRQFEVNINMSTNQGTTAADIEIFYDSCKLTVIDALPNAGIQIFTGSVFPSYPINGNVTTNSACVGNIQLTGFTTDTAGVLQGGGSGLFGKIRFKVRDINLSGSLLDIRTDGFGPSFTLDSNISDISGFDMLTAATDGTYNLRIDNDPVPDGDDRPTFGGFNPAASAAGVLIGANILFNTFDDESGVELNSVSNAVSINGVATTTYTTASVGVTPSCVTSNLDAVPVCNLTIDPSTNFPYDAIICSTVNANDLSETPITYVPTPNFAAPVTNCFRTQYDLTAPFTINNIPPKNSVNMAISTPFSFNLIDNETGSNINSAIVTIKGIDYTLAGPNFFTFTGTPNNYLITIPTPTLPLFVQNETVTVRIRAQDTATQLTVPTPNQLDETYTFKIGDTLPPFVSSSLPLPTTNFANACIDPIISIIEDTGSGVNINSVRIFVSSTGLYYTLAGPNFFTFTGTPSAYTVIIPAPSGCWTPNVPTAVGVFARDQASNYLDAYIYGLGGNASSTVTTIVNTVTNTINSSLVPTNIVDRELLKERQIIYRDRDIVREVAGLTPPEIIEKVIYIYKANPNKEEKKIIIDNVNKALVDLSNSVEKVQIEKINSTISTIKSFYFFEGQDLNIFGIGATSSSVKLQIGETRSEFIINIDNKGKWNMSIPDKLLGYNTYTISAQTIIDGSEIGVEKELGKITIIPWWWIVVIALTIIILLQIYKLDKKEGQVKSVFKRLSLLIKNNIKNK